MSAAADRQAPHVPVVLVTAALTTANLVALFLLLVWRIDRYEDTHRDMSYIVTQDLWVPMVVGMWALVLADALALMAWRPTRRVGIGMLVGVLPTVAGLFLLFFWIATSLS